jgi:hypothetical protein
MKYGSMKVHQRSYGCNKSRNIFKHFYYFPNIKSAEI